MRHLRADFHRMCSQVVNNNELLDSRPSSRSSNCGSYSPCSLNTNSSFSETTAISGLSHIETTPCHVLLHRLDKKTLSTYTNGHYVSAKWIAKREHIRRALNGLPPSIISTNLMILDEIMRNRQKVVKQERDELISAKRNIWCSHCMKMASIVCCWIKSYCSQDCRMSEWDWHQPHCGRMITGKDVATQSS